MNEEIEGILKELVGYDPSYEIVYFNSWSDFEEYGYIFIFFKDEVFYELEYQYSVMSDNNDESWDIVPLADHDVLEHMRQYDEIHGKYED